MTDPRQNDPWYDDPPLANSNLRDERRNATMWGWIVGFAVVIVIAFILAAGWNTNIQTARKAPPTTVGAGGPSQTVPPPATTGQDAGAPAMAPVGTAPQSPPTTK